MSIKNKTLNLNFYQYLLPGKRSVDTKQHAPTLNQRLHKSIISREKSLYSFIHLFQYFPYEDLKLINDDLVLMLV